MTCYQPHFKWVHIHFLVSTYRIGVHTSMTTAFNKKEKEKNVRASSTKATRLPNFVCVSEAWAIVDMQETRDLRNTRQKDISLISRVEKLPFGVGVVDWGMVYGYHAMDSQVVWVCMWVCFGDEWIWGFQKNGSPSLSLLHSHRDFYHQHCPLPSPVFRFISR